jgi:plastocyanin
MLRQVHAGLMAAGLTLGALGAASAQQLIPPGGVIGAYTGVITPFGYQPGWIPTTWYQPQVSYQYALPPQVVYVPVTVAAPRPAIERIQTVRVTLRSGAPVQDVRVKPGAVVTWTNGDDQPRTLVLEPSGLSRAGAQGSRQRGVVGPKASVSLAFNQPGVYRYYLQDKPDEQARIVVEE